MESGLNHGNCYDLTCNCQKAERHSCPVWLQSAGFTDQQAPKCFSWLAGWCGSWAATWQTWRGATLAQ